MVGWRDVTSWLTGIAWSCRKKLQLSAQRAAGENRENDGRAAYFGAYRIPLGLGWTGAPRREALTPGNDQPSSINAGLEGLPGALTPGNDQPNTVTSPKKKLADPRKSMDFNWIRPPSFLIRLVWSEINDFPLNFTI